MQEIIEYIRSDYHRYTGKKMYGLKNTILLFIIGMTGGNRRFRYSFWLRLAKKKNPFYLIAKTMLKRMSHKHGIYIHRKCEIGYGLMISHPVGIVINPETKIGNNVNISQFLTIGSNKGTPATIGDNVYIGPNVCLVENITIGNNATIGAGAVVVKDVPENATVAGVPAKVVSYNDNSSFICNPYTPKK